MKQEWFESNDFVKTISKNKPDEQPKMLQTRLKKGQPISIRQLKKNTQLEKEVSQAEVEVGKPARREN